MKLNVYIDGFNLYYGSLYRTGFKWLNPHAFCQATFPADQINRIRYFTARVKARPSDPDQHSRQNAYLRALETIPDLSVHLGSFLSHVRERPLAPLPGGKLVKIVETNEKGSDVNLASYLLLDAFKRDYEAAVVVSNDSDLVTPSASSSTSSRATRRTNRSTAW